MVVKFAEDDEPPSGDADAKGGGVGGGAKVQSLQFSGWLYKVRVTTTTTTTTTMPMTTTTTTTTTATTNTNPTNTYQPTHHIGTGGQPHEHYGGMEASVLCVR